MAKYDIVYILKNDINSEELRYSLRSVCENFPYRKIFFVGGCPKDIVPDIYIAHEQSGFTKWQKSRSSLLKILKNEELSDEFFLFNDDFFILKKVKGNYINFTNGTIERRINELRKNTGRISGYSAKLSELQTRLKMKGKDNISFAVHIPMLINKKKALEILSAEKECMFRSFYGNMANIPYTYHEDVKIYDNASLPKFDDFLSTTDEAFKDGAVGEWIRERFPTPCKYEIDDEVFTEEEE